MYKSRISKTIGDLTISLNSSNGRILSLFNEKTGDDLMKNLLRIPNPFALITSNGVITAPEDMQIDQNPELRPEIRETENSFVIIYPCVCCGGKILDIKVTAEIEFLGEQTAEFKINVENRSGLVISDCHYPCINGLYHGDSYENDVLVYPYVAGLKIKNPISHISKEPKLIHWQWQKYSSTYSVSGLGRDKGEDGQYRLYNYCCPEFSMKWTDYYSDNGGMYFGMHKDNGICPLSVSTFGDALPGMNFCFMKKVETADDFGMDGIVLALHEGDWREGAKIYKKVKSPWAKNTNEWFRNGAALFAHYDFRYQTEGVVHTFFDIPRLAEEARQRGVNHLLIAGWHRGGFDNGFPEYMVDEELGGEQKLREGIKKAHDMGVYISFYVNARLHNVNVMKDAKLLCEGRVIRQDGTPKEEQYGDKSIMFNAMCAASEVWQEHLYNSVKYLTELGADGVYLDQLALSTPFVCHNKKHKHGLYDWEKGYIKLLERVEKLVTKQGNKINIMTEGCSDVYGTMVDGQLISSFLYDHDSSFPELYRYMNPHQILVDMVYPKIKNVMRPTHIGRHSAEYIERTFVNGCYFWIYDLEEDNTFKKDTEQWAYLEKILKLSKKVYPIMSEYTFLNTDGMSAAEGVTARIYQKENEYMILYTRQGEGEKEIHLDFAFETDGVITADGTADLPQRPGKNTLILHGARAGAIFLHKQ